MEDNEQDHDEQATRKRFETEILLQLVGRLAGSGTLHLDTDAIDLSEERDYNTLTMLSTVVTDIVEQRTRQHIAREQNLRAALDGTDDGISLVINEFDPAKPRTANRAWLQELVDEQATPDAVPSAQ
jgi:hypothetical protein